MDGTCECLASLPDTLKSIQEDIYTQSQKQQKIALALLKTQGDLRRHAVDLTTIPVVLGKLVEEIRCSQGAEYGGIAQSLEDLSKQSRTMSLGLYRMVEMLKGICEKVMTPSVPKDMWWMAIDNPALPVMCGKELRITAGVTANVLILVPALHLSRIELQIEESIIHMGMRRQGSGPDENPVITKAYWDGKIPRRFEGCPYNMKVFVGRLPMMSEGVYKYELELHAKLNTLRVQDCWRSLHYNKDINLGLSLFDPRKEAWTLVCSPANSTQKE